MAQKESLRGEDQPVEVLETGEWGVAIRVPGSGRVYGIAVDYEHPNGETINVTELEVVDIENVHTIDE